MLNAIQSCHLHGSDEPSHPQLSLSALMALFHSSSAYLYCGIHEDSVLDSVLGPLLLNHPGSLLYFDKLPLSFRRKQLMMKHENKMTATPDNLNPSILTAAGFDDQSMARDCW